MSAPVALRAPTPFDLCQLVLVAVIWASAFIAIRVAVPETGPVWLAAIRVCIGFLVLAPYAIWRGMVWPKTGGQWRLITGMAVLNMVAPFYLIAWAGKTETAGIIGLLLGTGPFLALVGSHFLTTDDRMSARKVLSVILGFAGILVIIGPSVWSGMVGGGIAAKAAVLGASVCYVMAGLLIRRIDMPPIRLACLALGIGTAMLIPLALAVDGAPPAGISAKSLMALVFLGVFPTGVAYILRFKLIKEIGYTRFSVAVNMVPVFGVGLGVLLLGEPLTPSILVALALVLGGLIISSSGRSAPRTAERPGETPPA